MLRRVLVLVILLLAAGGASAQTSTARPGDPPLLERIHVSPPDATGIVTIEGDAGTVFPSAYISIRNMFTGATVTTRSGGTGSFIARIAASGSTPFWVSPSEAQPSTADLAVPGWLPGGPGVIVYGVLANTPERPVTQLVIDGDLSDWNAYPGAERFRTATRAAYAISNADSLYVAFTGTYISTAYAKVEVRFTVEISTYTVTLDPRQAQAAELRRVNPVADDLGTLIVAARQDDALELRIPLTFVDRVGRVRLDGVRWLNASGGEISADNIDAEVPPLDEIDGVMQVQASADAVRFNFDGVLAKGGVYSVDGVADTLAVEPGAVWRLALDVRFNNADLPANARMVGQLALQPVAVSDSPGGVARVVGGISTHNGWSSEMTPGGLPIDNLRSEVVIGEATALPFQLVRGANSISFPLTFRVTIPDDLPPGLYVPFFTGFTQVPDAERARWEAADAPPARTPLVVSVGGVTDARLLWTLFAESPSDGSRGILSAEDQAHAVLSNRVRFNSPTYILPPFSPGTRNPITYSLEPYLLNQLSNSTTGLVPPLIPFPFPNGELNLRIIRPDGTVNDVGSTPIVQNRLGTADDERVQFGRQSPINEYHLTTLNPRFGGRTFDQYGEYTVILSGSMQDAWGNRYEGGGTYRFLSAELLDLTPGVLAGTPFVVGDALNFGLHLSPGVPADVTVRLRVYPLDGGIPFEKTVTGKANARGYFQPDDAPYTFDTPGEYVIDYEARYTGGDGRLWAASLRSAGVIGGESPTIVARGERGLPGVDALHPAWFRLPQLTEGANTTPNPLTFSFPYYSGDVLWLQDGINQLIDPAIHLQDLSGQYTQWLKSENELASPLMASEGALPILMRNGGESYSYISTVRPNVSVRQFVSGGDDGGLLFSWDGDDPHNQQIGAGLLGSRPIDYIFLFGGAVVRAGDLLDSAIYGAVAVITSDGTPRVFPPDRGAAGSADGGSLLTVKGRDYDAFIYMTGVQPGEVLTVGDRVTVAGQVAPALAASVATTFTAPSGRVVEFVGKANPVGSYYDPDTRFIVDEPGVWTVDVRVAVDGVTSAGQVEPPYPQGGVLGANGGRFSIYVLPPDSEPLNWNPLLRDTIIPIVSPYDFSFTMPADWTNIDAYYVLTTPGYIIEDAELLMNGRSFTYTYNAPAQNRLMPNLENDGNSGAYRADVRTLTFVVTGVDASGTMQMRSRTFTLIHDHLITTE